MKGSIARPNRPMSPRKAKLEAKRRAFIASIAPPPPMSDMSGTWRAVSLKNGKLKFHK